MFDKNIEQQDFVDTMFQKIDELLSNHNNSRGASLVLWILSVTVGYLGWDKLEEAKKFAEYWQKVKDKLKAYADSSEFIIQNMTIENNLAQLLDKQIYSSVIDRTKSALTLPYHQISIMYFLENSFRT